MGWVERVELRSQTAKTWRDTEQTGQHHREQVIRTALHYPSAGPDSEVFDQEEDWTPVRVDDAEFDGWHSYNGWHFSLGQPVGQEDGWVGFGGRQGQHWLLFRLLRVGYLHWSTRSWQDVGASPTYDRADLSSELESMSIGPEGAEETLNVSATARWRDVWTTPGGGFVDVRWRSEGYGLKEELIINQAAREWIAANEPPTTPAGETWFGFVFEIDPGDIPKWVINEVLQDPEDDFTDDDGRIELYDALDHVLAFMPISVAYSQRAASGEQDVVTLRKRLWKQNGTYYLLVGARVDELNGMRAGAITFDPTFSTQAADKDCYVYDLVSGNNAGTCTVLFISDNHGTWGNGRALIQFDCSSIPADAVCDSATLYLWKDVWEGGSDTGTVYVYAIAVGNSGWPEGGHCKAAGGADDCCWDYYDQDSGSETNWAGSAGLSTSGTDYEASSLGSFSITNDDAEGTEYSTTLTAARVEGWFGSTNTNYGILLIYDNDPNACDLRASEHATAGNRPKISIDYTVRVPRHPAVVYQVPAIY